MKRDDVTSESIRLMTVCNSCRYCEQYCAVFPAMTEHLTFDRADIDYLANLCHNCGECLYACQYAPPHEFAIDLPRMLAKARVQSYQAYCWPAALGAAFRAHQVWTALLLSAVLSVALGVTTWAWNPDALALIARSGDFYAVIPHNPLVMLFVGVSLFVLLAISIATLRFWRDTHEGPFPSLRSGLRGLRDALTLRYLHASGRDCTVAEEERVPWRRLFHHCTFYGFLLCFASTTVAAFYHSVMGWEAPYPFTSIPVLLGSAGGVGLVVGPVGLLWMRRRRDPALADADQQGLDESFIVLLALTSITGLVLLILRTSVLMAPLLMIHLGAVLALFLTLPYGKFMHGFYRVAALVKFAVDRDQPARDRIGESAS